MSTESVLPANGGIGTLVSVILVVSPSTTGSVVAVGFGDAAGLAEAAPDAAGLAEADADAAGLALAGAEAATEGLAAALEAGALAAGAAAPPHAASSSETAAKVGTRWRAVMYLLLFQLMRCSPPER